VRERPIFGIKKVAKTAKKVAKTAKKADLNSGPAPKPAPKKKYPPIDEVVEQIKKLLRAKQTYSANLDQTIYVAATNYLAMMHIQGDIARAAKSYYSYIDAQGNRQYKIKPEYAKLPDITSAAVKSFRALGLTLDTLDSSDDDPLEKLNARVQSMKSNG